MIQKTIAQIEAKLSGSASVKPAEQAELRRLLDHLKAEVSELSKTNKAGAVEIVQRASASAEELVRGGHGSANLQDAVKKLEASVAGFEGSHPTLVQVVNRICTALSNLGI